MVNYSSSEDVEVVQTIEEKESNITLLEPKMQRFIHLYMTGQYTLVKLADLLDVHPVTLGRWLKRPDVKAMITEMEQDTHNMVAIQLKSLTNKAVTKLSNLVDSPIDGVALNAVKDILDRSGHKPKQEIKVDKTVTTYEQRLQSLINDVIEVEYEVTENEE